MSVAGARLRGTGNNEVRAFVNDQTSEGVVRQALTDLGLDEVSIATGTVASATAVLAKHASPRLLIVDLSGVDDPLSAILGLAEVCEAGVSIIAIGDSNDISLYRQLKHAGVAEYFFKPLIRDQISRACNDILNDRQDQPSLFAGKLMFVCGVRGGVGATTLATNMAWYVAEARQRWTILVDLDLHGGDAALLFDAPPGAALREAFERPERMDKLFLERAVTTINPRLNLLASLEPLGSTVEGSEEAVSVLLERLLRRYRLVIVDMPAAIAESLPNVLQMPSMAVLVANPSLTGARDMARWRDRLGQNMRDRRTLQVLNHTSAYGGLTEAEFARASGQAPDVVIPFDRELAITANLGVSSMQECAMFKFGMAKILHEVTGDPVEKPSTLFNRIFRK